MIGLDTNVLVRLVVNDEPQQVVAATTFLTQHCSIDNPAFINVTVLCELVWTLERSYSFGRADIGSAIAAILANGMFAVEAAELVRIALDRYLRQGFDLADFLIGGINQERGCDTTLTFDRKAAKLDGFRLLS